MLKPNSIVRPFSLRTVSAFSSFALLLLCLFTIFPYAKQSKHAAALIDPSQYGLSLSASSTVSMQINPSTAGTLAVKKDTITASTTSPSGYKLYLATSTTDNNIYLNGLPSNNTLDKKITPTTGTYDTPTPLTSTSTAPATWGYAIPGLHNFDPAYSESTPSDTAKFAALPLLGQEQLIHHSTTPATNQTTDIYYGAKANTTVSSGTYLTTVHYYSVVDVSDQPAGEANITPDTLNTDYPLDQRVSIKTSLKTSLPISNFSALINNQPCTNPTITSDNPITISCQVPAGLSANPTGYDVSISFNIGTQNRTYTIPNGLRIINPVIDMQTFTPQVCQSLTLNQQYRAKDTRDNKEYFISRLKMNREGTETACWMTQNLALDLNTATTLTPDNTDIPTPWTPERNTINSTGTFVPGWTNDDNHPYSANSGDTYYYTSGSNANDRTYTSLSACTAAGHTEDDCKHYHVGNYYNWSAAVAKNDTSSHNTNYDDVNQSICPKGWRLPKGMTAPAGPGVSGDYSRLFYANNITDILANQLAQSLNYTPDGLNNIRKSPLYFVRGGGVYNQSITGQASSDGDYWLSTAGPSPSASSMIFTKTYLFPQHVSVNNRRMFGYSLRCLAHGNYFKLTFSAGSEAQNTPSPLHSPEDYSNTPPTSHTFTLPPAIPTRPGKAFKGWATTSSATTPDYAYNAGTFTPNTITVSDPTTTLYAVWGDMKSMQSFTSADCQALAIGEQRQLYDTRDNKIYFVSRLKMNREGTETKCWMTQNLALDLSTTTTLTSDDTDLPAGTSWTPERNTINFTGTSVPGWSNSYHRPYSANPGDAYYYTSGNDSNDTIYPSLSACTSAGHSEYDCKHYHAGNYYNFTAAIAMNNSSTYNTNYQTIPQSICPKGWRLPTSMTGPSTAGDFAKLLYANSITDTLATQLNQNLYYASGGFTNLRANPLYFSRNGYADSGSLLSPGYVSQYSSSSVNSPNSHYILNFGLGYLSPTNHLNRYYGFSVRCLLR